MNTTLRVHFGVSWLSSLALLLLIASPAAARERKTPEPARSPTCEHPCTHVAECPKVSCECDGATGSGVAACDADEAHCCVEASTACERFCEVNHQKWTGRFTPEGGGTRTDGAKAPAEGGALSSCAERCQKGEDCHRITCQCAHDTVEGVAACDANTSCCADAKIVCEHYCEGKKGKWTGKVVDAPSQPSHPSVRSLLGEPDDGLNDDDDYQGLGR